MLIRNTGSRSLRWFVAATAALTLLAPVAHGQAITGRVLGTVKDSTQAIVPGANITITNEETGILWKSKSDPQGNFIAPSLPPGSYRVEVEIQGFHRAIFTGTTVDVAQDTRVDAVLAVGSTSETVEVHGTAEIVRSTTSEVGTIVDQHEIQTLPLNGRLFSQLVQLTPGTVPTGWADAPESGSGAGARTAIMSQVNGLPYAGSNYTIDGVANKEVMNAYIALSPPVEALEEFKVQTSNPSAEFGAYGGAVVNLTIRSGTNQVHGSAFEYFRNNDLNARTFFAAVRPSLRSNQFGGTVGGPIIKNKAFFFADYQGLLLNYPASQYYTMPSALMDQGIFSSAEGFPTVYDPTTHTPFPNNQVPAARFDPVAAKVLGANIWLPPNQAPTAYGVSGPSNNFFANVGQNQDSRQFDVKVDYQLNTNSRMFARESYAWRLSNYAAPAGDIFLQSTGNNPNSNNLSYNAVIGHTYTFSSSLLNELRLGFMRFYTTDYGNDYPIPENNLLGIPNGNLPQYPASYGIAGFSITGLSGTGATAWTDAHRITNEFQVTEGLTWIQGRHTIKFGANLQKILPSLTNPTSSPRGSFSFTTAYTSNQVNTNNTGSAFASFLLGDPNSISRGFVNTDPAVVMYSNGVYAQDDFRVNKSLTVNLGLRYDVFTAPTERHNRQTNFSLADGLMHAASSSDPTAGVDTFKKAFGPRLGFAWSPDGGKTAIRSAFGLSYFTDQFGASAGTLEQNYPLFETISLTDPSPSIYTPFSKLSVNGLPGPQTEALAPTIAVPSGVVPYIMPRNFQPDETLMWNFGMQRQLTRTGALDISYVGTRGVHLFRGTNINTPVPGPGTNTNLNRPYYSLVPLLTTITLRQSNADSHYNSLQVKYTKQYANGLFGMVSYTFSKSIDDLTSFYVYQDRLNRGLSGTDVPHNFIASYGYDLPFGKGRTYLGAKGGLIDAVAGGWTINGVTTVRSGTPLTVTTSTNLLNAPGITQRANIVCSHVGISKDLAKWFDTTCFAAPTQSYVLGNGPQGFAQGPGMMNWDLSAFKRFTIVEKKTLEFRAEFFNAFNQAHFSNPNTQVGNTNFGKITGTSLPAREIQLGLKLAF